MAWITVGWFKAWKPQAQSALISAIIGAAFGLIGGIAGPIIQGRLQQSSDLSKVRLEDALKRQAKLIDSQDAFLNDMTAALWDWRYVSIRVCYYGSTGREEAYNRSWFEYDENIWRHLNRIRSLMSQYRRLGSEDTFRELRSFYEVAVNLDRDISAAAAERSPEVKERLFSDLNQFIYGVISDQVDRMLFLIASDLNLNRSDPAK